MQSKQVKMKLAAAAVVAALAAPAQAAIQFGDSGELFWSIWDEGGARSYVRDLGLTIDTFLGIGPGQKFEFSNDATLNTFLTETSDVSKLVWNIVAFDNVGPNRVVSTAGTVPSSLRNGAIRSFDDNSASYAGAVDALVGAGVDNGSLIATADDGLAYFDGGAFGSNFGSAQAGSLVNTVGIAETASMYLFSQVGSSNTAFGTIQKIAVNGFDVTASYSDGKLVIQAVPEPSTYGLMAAGLLAVGALARRRRKV